MFSYIKTKSFLLYYFVTKNTIVNSRLFSLPLFNISIIFTKKIHFFCLKSK